MDSGLVFVNKVLLEGSHSHHFHAVYGSFHTAKEVL